jgi:AraC-like DNA-binding protein
MLVSQFQQLVDHYFKQEHSVEFYAQRLGLTGKALTTKLSKAIGKSAGAVIQERCLIEAKRLLAHSDLSIAEIGYQIGYEDPNYFARFFRRKTGHTPGEFRKRATRPVRA